MASNIILLEHVNLAVARGHLPSAHAFFIVALGLSEDPRPRTRRRDGDLLWGNAGLSQLHLPMDLEDAPVSDASTAWCERLEGGAAEMVFVIPRGSTSAAAARLRAAGASLLVRGERSLLVDAPCGRIVLEEAASEADAAAMAAHIARFRGHPCGADSASEGAPVALARVTLVVETADLVLVRAFWRDVLGARVEEGVEGRVRIFIGEGPCAQHLDLYPPTPGAPTNRTPGYHLAIYISDYEATFERALRAGLVWDNPRFSDRGGTLELALANHQFRTRTLGVGGPILELEIRAITHPSWPMVPVT